MGLDRAVDSSSVENDRVKSVIVAFSLGIEVLPWLRLVLHHRVARATRVAVIDKESNHRISLEWVEGMWNFMGVAAGFLS